MTDIENDILKEAIKDDKITQKYEITSVYDLTEGGIVKKIIRIGLIREKLFPKVIEQGLRFLRDREFPLLNEKPTMIKEGLIKTYPISPLIDELKKTTGLSDIRFQCQKIDDKSGIAEYVKIIIFETEETEHLLKTIDRIMEKGGYFFGGKRKIFIGQHYGHEYYFRPKFPSTTIRDLPRYLYHITDAYTANKIRKNGFYPKNKNNRGYYYPDRVHFFAIDDLKEMLYYAIIADKGMNNGKDKAKVYTIFQIDTAKITGTVFFKDFDYNPDKTESIFTYSYIPPSAISKEQTIDLEKYKNG